MQFLMFSTFEVFKEDSDFYLVLVLATPGLHPVRVLPPNFTGTAAILDKKELMSKNVGKLHRDRNNSIKKRIKKEFGRRARQKWLDKNELMSNNLPSISQVSGPRIRANFKFLHVAI